MREPITEHTQGASVCCTDPEFVLPQTWESHGGNTSTLSHRCCSVPWPVYTNVWITGLLYTSNSAGILTGHGVFFTAIEQWLRHVWSTCVKRPMRDAAYLLYVYSLSPPIPPVVLTSPPWMHFLSSQPSRELIHAWPVLHHWGNESLGLTALKSSFPVAQLLHFSLYLVLAWRFKHVLYNSLIEIEFKRHIAHRLKCVTLVIAAWYNQPYSSREIFPTSRNVCFSPRQPLISLCLCICSLCAPLGSSCAVFYNYPQCCAYRVSHPEVCAHTSLWSHT